MKTLLAWLFGTVTARITGAQPEDFLNLCARENLVLWRMVQRDLFTLEEAPRLGCGLMVMERTTFPWTLTYDEMDYVIEGRLDILVDGQTVSAGPGEVLYIPKDTSIQFSVRDKARFLYFVYPANWQN